MSDPIIFTSNEVKSNLPVPVGAHVMKVSGTLGGGTLAITDTDGVPVYSFTGVEQRGVFVTTSHVNAELTSSSSPNCQLHIIKHV